MCSCCLSCHRTVDYQRLVYRDETHTNLWFERPTTQLRAPTLVLLCSCCTWQAFLALMDSCRLYGEPDAIVVSAEAFPDPHPTVVLNPMTSIIAVSCPSSPPAAGLRHVAC